MSDSLQRDGGSEHPLLLLKPQEKGSQQQGSEDNNENLPALFAANTSPGEFSPPFLEVSKQKQNNMVLEQFTILKLRKMTL